MHAHHHLLADARAQADTDDFYDTYRRLRPMIERTIAWLVKDITAGSATGAPNATSSPGRTAAPR